MKYIERILIILGTLFALPLQATEEGKSIELTDLSINVENEPVHRRNPFDADSVTTPEIQEIPRNNQNWWQKLTSKQKCLFYTLVPTGLAVLGTAIGLIVHFTGTNEEPIIIPQHCVDQYFQQHPWLTPSL